MSLFPAYSGTHSTEKTNTNDSENEKKSAQSWLANPSFIEHQLPGSDVETAQKSSASIVQPIVIDDESNDNSCTATTSDTTRKKKSKKKEHKHKKSKKKAKEKHKEKKQEEPIIFNGTESYYVDKKSERGYLNVVTLHRPACPRYRAYRKPLGYFPLPVSKTIKRYYVKNKRDKIEFGDWNDVERLTEHDFSAKNKNFNKRLGENPGDIDLWIEFVKHQDMSHMKSTKIQLVERKMDILNKALKENPSNEQFYRLYVDIIDNAYPSFEVSKILDGLLAKDPTNYILWTAQIFASQGSMARCIVPDVLKLYERCMKSMYNKNRYDEVMLKLFTNCTLFMRQAGLYEQFFALIKLALELNVSSNKFTNIQPSEDDQNTLIEYEEVILKSGLPMNEIWLRIEKLRQNFYFLPCPENRSCSDPQRIAFNEDIVHFVYPLVNKEYCFNLAIIILKLLKIPLPGHSIKHCFFTKQEHCSEFDSIEELLPVFLCKTFLDIPSFDLILLELIKDFSIGPSYVTTNIGHDIYFSVVTEMLLICSECFVETNRKHIFILLWLKFERIVLTLDKLMGKTTEEKTKKLRSKVKNLLKREEHRNVLVYFTEYALIEYELGNLNKMEMIFHTAIGETKAGDDDCTRSEFYSTYIAYIEVLMCERNFDIALRVLTCLALNNSIKEYNEIEMSENRKLLAIKKITDRLSELVFIERNVDIMELEQCFQPDYLISLIKAKIYLILFIKNKKEAIEQLEILLKTFPDKNNRHTFVRENLYELYANIIQLPDKSGTDANMLIFSVLKRGLEEFPNNLCLLRISATIEGWTWHNLRSLLTKHNSPVSVVFLVAAAKHRYQKYIHSMSNATEFHYLSSNIDANEFTYKTRICNLLRSVTSKISPARKNSLLWRIYLRSLLDLHKNFDKSRNTLFAALDECPWNKAIYLDGTVYVPQELPHIQDVMIEKQLRMYALPEELEILRNDDIEIPKE